MQKTLWKFHGSLLEMAQSKSLIYLFNMVMFHDFPWFFVYLPEGNHGKFSTGRLGKGRLGTSGADWMGSWLQLRW
jgi:hypothetical protein